MNIGRTKEQGIVICHSWNASYLVEVCPLCYFTNVKILKITLLVGSQPYSTEISWNVLAVNLNVFKWQKHWFCVRYLVWKKFCWALHFCFYLQFNYWWMIEKRQQPFQLCGLYLQGLFALTAKILSWVL